MHLLHRTRAPIVGFSQWQQIMAIPACFGSAQSEHEYAVRAWESQKINQSSVRRATHCPSLRCVTIIARAR